MKIKVNDINMHVEIVGEGKPIVLLHGVGLDHTIWLEMAQLYQDQARFVLLDLRGEGQSEAGDANHTLEQMAEDVLGVLDKLGIAQALLGGHSMGGYIALAFAEKHPERLEGLALIATNAGRDSEEKKIQRYADAEAILKHGSHVLANSMSPKLSLDPQIQELTRKLIAATEPRGLANTQLAIAQRPERFDVLATLTCPILIAAGKEDQIIPAAAVQAMIQANPKAHSVFIPGAGHMPMMEAPRTLGALLVAL
jgi:pimeloyl-ACP methyl ester carboxylesterase